MVNILGIESSGSTSGIYISADNRLLGQTTLNVKNIHSRLMAKMTGQLLDHLNLRYADLDAIAFSAGPGSFTGLRIGYSFGKGLAHRLNLTVLQIPTLDIFAYQYGETSEPVISLIDAHRGELFCARYEWKKNKLDRTTEYLLHSVENINDIIPGKTVVVGMDVEKLGDSLRNAGTDMLKFPYPPVNEPQGWALLDLAFQKFSRNEFADLESCEPMYMRAFKGVM